MAQQGRSQRYPSGPTTQEQELVDAARAGDARAFSILVEQLQGRVYHFLLRHTSDPSAAEDLAQDTFLEAFRSLERFQGASKFSTWVIGIAFNLARNHRNRSPQRRQEPLEDALMATLADDRATPHEQAAASALMRALHRGLDSLAPDMREALVLVAMDGLPYEEAAQVMGVAIGTVKTRVFRARQRLRAFLEAEDAWPWDDASA